MRLFTFLFLLCCSVSAFVPVAVWAADDESEEKEAAPSIDAPQITFAQQVEIVVETKRDPRVLEMKITQDKENIQIDMIADRSQDHEQVKEVALVAIMRTKMRSLDDRPTSAENLGKGIYNYTVTISRPDGVVLLTAKKPKGKKKLTFEDPIPLAEPWTRADAAGR